MLTEQSHASTLVEMRRKPEASLIQKRTAQRAHAKKRLRERFQVELNRDRIRAVEEQIRNGRAICTGGQGPKKTWLVEVDGRVLLAAYDSTTQRLVTVLPEECLNDVPAGLMTRARVRLLASVQAEIAAAIRGGRSEIVWESSADLSYHRVQYEGELFHFGFHSATGQLLGYKKQPKGKREPTQTFAPTRPDPHSLFEPLQLPNPVAEEYRSQIREGTSRFLWRYSGTFCFHEVQRNGERLRVGYSTRKGDFYAYADPPDEMADVRLSLMLLAEPPESLAAVIDQIRTGRAELMEVRGPSYGIYSVDWQGKTVLVGYSAKRDVIESYSPAKANGAKA